MTAHKCTVAKFKTLIKDFPKLVHIAARCASNINKVDCNNTLIKSAVVLLFALNIVLCSCDIAYSRFGKSVRSEERTATHRSVNITLEVEHNFFAYIVGYHTLCSTLCGKLCKIVERCVFVDIIIFQNIYELWECRCNPNTLFVLNALDSLAECFLNNECKVFLFLLVLCFVKIHKHSNKRSLTVGCEKCYNLILNSLNAS